MRFGSIICGVLPFLGSVCSYANPGACLGACVNTHDPSIIRRSDGTYFRFSTGGKVAVHTAPEITGAWTYKVAALPSGSSIDFAGNQDLWVSPSNLRPAPAPIRKGQHNVENHSAN